MPKAFGSADVTPDTNWQRIVIVDVHSMRGLKAGSMFDKSDPFFTVRTVPTSFPESFVSRVVSNSTEPDYEQRAIFLVPEGQDELEFIAKDYDGSGKNSFDELGRVNIKFALYELGGRVSRQWFALDTQGEVELSMLVLNGEAAADKIGELEAAKLAKEEALAASAADDADDAATIEALTAENERLAAELAEARSATAVALEEVGAAIAGKNEAQQALADATALSPELQELSLAPAALAPPLPAVVAAALPPFTLRCTGNGGEGGLLHLDGGGDKLLSSRYCQGEGEQDEFCQWRALEQEDGTLFLQCVANDEVLHLDGGGDRLVSTRYCQDEGAQDVFCCFELRADGGSFLITSKATGGFLHLDGNGDKLVSTRYCQGEGAQDEFCRFTISPA